MQFDHYFPVWHYIRVDSKVAGLKSRLLIIICIARDMRLGVHYFELKCGCMSALLVKELMSYLLI